MNQLERNQEFFNNFVSAVNGKGRAYDTQAGMCRYKMPPESEHPGCAVGCQPLFKKVNQLFPMPSTDENTPISAMINTFPKSSDFRKALSLVLSYEDGKFLSDLQSFHDYQGHWKNDYLILNEVQKFCETHNLKVPSALYYLDQSE